MNNGDNIVTISHVAAGKNIVAAGLKTLRFVFHDFKRLPDSPFAATECPSVSCHSLKWSLLLYPGGNVPNSQYASIVLKSIPTHCDVKGFSIRFRVPSAGHSTTSTKPHQGMSQWIPRADLLNPKNFFLIAGKLTVEVDILLLDDQSRAPSSKNTLQQDMLRMLFGAQESGDVEFIVGNESFYAHRNILQARAPGLAELARDYPPNTVIPLSESTTASTFHSFLVYLYTDFPPDDIHDQPRTILDVADRYGCRGLKKLAETELVASCITVDTAAELLLLGDAKNCALLTEAAIDFIATNLAGVKSTIGWNDLSKSAPLLDRIIDAVVDRA